MPYQSNHDELEHSLRALEQKQHNLHMHRLHLNHQLTEVTNQRHMLLHETETTESVRQLTQQEQKLLSYLKAVQDMQDELQQEHTSVGQLLAAVQKQAVPADESSRQRTS